MKRENIIVSIRTVLSVTAAVLVGTTSFAEETRVWTSNANGRQFRGSLVKVEENSISIRRESDNVIFQVKKADLIQGDLDWISKNAPKQAPAGAVEDLSGLISEVPASTGTPAIAVLLRKGFSSLWG